MAVLLAVYQLPGWYARREVEVPHASDAECVLRRGTIRGQGYLRPLRTSSL
jgi:hypothetical protein